MKYTLIYSITGMMLLFFLVFSLAVCEPPDDPADTTPPVVTITSPADSGIATGNTLIRADASDDVAVESVTFYTGAVLLSKDTTAPYEYTWELDERDNARYTIVVVAEDTSGNYALDSVTITVAVDAKVKMPVPSIFTGIFPQDAVISFTSGTPGAIIYTGISSNEQATVPDAWVQESCISLNETGTFKVFARAEKNGLPDSLIFSELINVASEFLPAAGQAGSDAVSMDDSSIIAWATGYENYITGEDCDIEWQTPEKALGQATGESYDIACLGNGGSITLTFAGSITNGEGPDFAVFENSFNNTFLEFAYVEVSSNGTDFIRFDCTSLTESPVGVSGAVQPEDVNGLAGKYKQGYGTPFDLSCLKYRGEVRDGTINITNITHIRFIDIRGNPDSGITDYDSFGNIIYDPYKCSGSGGFDLDAVGVLYQLYK